MFPTLSPLAAAQALKMTTCCDVKEEQVSITLSGYIGRSVICSFQILF